MLKRLAIRGFKSLQGVDIALLRCAVPFGPSAAGLGVDLAAEIVGAMDL